MRAVDAIMECLKAEGVEVVFGLPGGANLPTYDAFVDAGIDITKKLSFSADMIWINGWKYAPADGQSVQTATGNVAVPRGSDATTFTQATWFIADVDYELFDELTLGVGYYNLQNVIAPDGTRRGIFSGDNVWWSPDSRIFFDVTANLDKVYERFAGTKKKDDKNAPVVRDGPDGVTFYTLPDQVVNIQSADGKPTFLKLKLTFEMHDADTADALTDATPRLEDMFTSFLRELRPEDLSGSQGSYQLRMEILRRVNLVIAPSKANAVLIEEMLIN